MLIQKLAQLRNKYADYDHKQIDGLEEVKAEYIRCAQEYVTLTGDEYAIPYDLGCVPSPSGSGETIIQDDATTYVIFLPLVSSIYNAEKYSERGIAIVECTDCSWTKFGYPNDEGSPEHPLYPKGLNVAWGVAEVINSSWIRELHRQMEGSAKRIWRNQYSEVYSFDESGNRIWGHRHFIFGFKENTFECIAAELKLTISKKEYKEILNDITNKILEY